VRHRFSRPSPALVISLIALFVALGGTGYAAATGSIDSREIKNSTIQGKDVKNSSLTGSDVKNNSLTGSDILESKLGTVPVAGRAGTATTAGLATSIADNSVSSSKVADGALTAKDIGTVVIPSITHDFGTIPANSCTNNLTNIGAGGILKGSYVILTPDFSSANTSIQYDAQIPAAAADTINLHACNDTNAAVADGNTTFSVLVIR
jgi:hypothetical protein